jgi:hypothetical protein
MLKEGVRTQFLTNTDETGRFVVYSQRTGRTYFIEPMGDPHREWGSMDPATKEMKHKKAWKKYRGSIDEKDSLITEENGFENIQILTPGTSPFAAIEAVDAKYPDKV